MKELNNQQEITSLLEEKQSFMLYCSTQTCMPCKILKPEIENNLSEFNDKMNYISLEKTEDLAVKFNFKSVLLLYEDISTCLIISSLWSNDNNK